MANKCLNNSHTVLLSTFRLILGDLKLRLELNSNLNLNLLLDESERPNSLEHDNSLILTIYNSANLVHRAALEGLVVVEERSV